jgi:hypothetical protein
VSETLLQDVMSTELCSSCHERLVIEVEPDSDVEEGTSAVYESVLDDIELSCGCHYHWYAGRYRKGCATVGG